MAEDKDTDYRESHMDTETMDHTLLDTLNTFFARFECEIGADNKPQQKDCPLQLQQHQVRAVLHRVNMRKVAGPDGVTGKVLKSCAD